MSENLRVINRSPDGVLNLKQVCISTTEYSGTPLYSIKDPITGDLQGYMNTSFDFSDANIVLLFDDFFTTSGELKRCLDKVNSCK